MIDDAHRFNISVNDKHSVKELDAFRDLIGLGVGWGQRMTMRGRRLARSILSTPGLFRI
jgi:hypothetical protein